MTRTVSQKRKPTVAIIGAGRLGQALALALSDAGYSLVALVARRRQKAEKAAAVLKKKGGVVALAADQLAELPESDLVLISTPDDVIAEVALTVASLQPGRQRVVLHTSGALSSKVLAPLAAKGFETGSLHPLASITDPTTGAQSLHGAFFCIEGTTKAKALAKAIVRDLGGRSFAIKPEQKALYHAAALTASPQLTALFDVAIELLAKCGLSRRQAQEVFMPLLESTVNNLRTATPQQALTGTFARGDTETVKRHLRALSAKHLTDVLQIYKLLGRHSLQLAEENGLDAKRVQEIRKLLEET